MPQLKNSQQRWLCALVISWILFLACNWVLNLWKLQPLLSFRSGREKAALTRDDVVEILTRAGGIRALSKNEGAPASRSNGGLSTPDPFATLLAKVGITATFVPENSPTRCIIKWYPNRSVHSKQRRMSRQRVMTVMIVIHHPRSLIMQVRLRNHRRSWLSGTGTLRIPPRSTSCWRAMAIRLRIHSSTGTFAPRPVPCCPAGAGESYRFVR